MNLYLIRHGRQNSDLCNVDVELSKEGIWQAECLAKRLESYKIDVLYSSDLIRAVQTAEIINSWGIEHIIRKELREIDFGDLTGKTVEEINSVYADFKLERWKMEEDIPFPNGESGEDVFNRVQGVVNEIISGNKKEVAVVTHGGTIRSILAGVLGLSQSKKLLFGIGLEKCSITKLHYDKEYKRFILESFNDYAHWGMNGRYNSD